MISADLKIKCFIDHLVLTVSDIARTRIFYSKILGEPDYFDNDSVMYFIGETRLFFALPLSTLPKGDKFDPNRIGLDHFAIGVRTREDLKQLEGNLDDQMIKHSRIHLDRQSKKEKIWLDDLDGIRLEFFLR